MPGSTLATRAVTESVKKVVAISTAALGIAVLVAAGTHWRDVYYAIWPEARLIGRWVPVEQSVATTQPTQHQTTTLPDGSQGVRRGPDRRLSYLDYPFYELVFKYDHGKQPVIK